jgi:Na+/H+-dicarboxylate symporter
MNDRTVTVFGGTGFLGSRVMIAPIIFCTVVSGIAHIQEAKKVGRVAVKALIYFEVVSTFALGLGLRLMLFFDGRYPRRTWPVLAEYIRPNV